MISWAGQYQISPNGRWIAGTFRTETAVDDGNSIEQTFSPAFYDVENNKTYIMSEYGDGSGMVVTDDGIGFIGTPSLYTSSCQVVKIETGESSVRSSSIFSTCTVFICLRDTSYT